MYKSIKNIPLKDNVYAEIFSSENTFEIAYNKLELIALESKSLYHLKTLQYQHCSNTVQQILTQSQNKHRDSGNICVCQVYFIL